MINRHGFYTNIREVCIVPILGCIALFIVLYFVVSYKEKNTDISTHEELFESHGLTEPCEKCNRLIDIGWRYCPYCGHVKEEV